MQTIFINASTTAEKEVLFALVDVSGSAIDTAITISAGDIWWRTANSVLAQAAGAVSSVGLNLRQYVPTAAEVSVTGVAAFKFRRTGYADFQALIQIIPQTVSLLQGLSVAGVTFTRSIPPTVFSEIIQGSATPFVFQAYGVSSGSPATGVSISAANFFWSHDGSSFVSTSGIVSEVGSGYYKYTPGTVEVSARGYNTYRLSSTSYMIDNIYSEIVGPLLVDASGRPEVYVVSVANSAIRTAAFETSTIAAFSDNLLGRVIGGGSSGGRTVTQALRALRNKVLRTDQALYIYDETDASISWDASLTTSASSLPITTVDPV